MMWLIAALIPCRAYADSVVLGSPTSITLTEDGSDNVFLYGLSNKSGPDLPGPIMVDGTNFVQSGDESEIVSINWSTGLIDSSPLWCYLQGAVGFHTGAVCGMALEIKLADGTGESDGDSYTAIATLTASFGTNPEAIVPLTVDITVNDPNATPSPEPSSLLLLGPATLGIIGLGFWRKRLG